MSGPALYRDFFLSQIMYFKLTTVLFLVTLCACLLGCSGGSTSAVTSDPNSRVNPALTPHQKELRGVKASQNN
jgi:hypothetical protein